MIRLIVGFIFSLCIITSVSAGYIPVEESDFCKDGRDPEIIASIPNTEVYLKASGVQPLEGIWEYPADETSLLILRSRTAKGVYDIYLYDSTDCRLSRGMKVGTATATADPLRFSLSLCSRLRKDILTSPLPCAGKLSAEGDMLIINSPKIKLSLTPSIILPSLWNTLRLSTRIRTENPADKLPHGLRKVYPTFDGNPPSKSAIRYL